MVVGRGQGLQLGGVGVLEEKVLVDRSDQGHCCENGFRDGKDWGLTVGEAVVAVVIAAALTPVGYDSV